MEGLERIGMCCLILAVMLVTLVSADGGRIKLLAVTENPDGSLAGTTADLFLDIKPGRGRVFIETFPLAKIDTQISTRFAKDIACNYIDLDCSKYDFFYTISSDSSIIGGPSAGAATAVLTSVVLLGLDYDENISITGTINSGGIIGPVGGVSEKISAAKRAGIDKVLIPVGGDSFNDTFGAGFSVVPVSTLDDAIWQFTGRRKVYQNKNFSISPEYRKVMTTLADELCTRAKETGVLVRSENNLTSKDLFSIFISAENLTEKGQAAYSNGEFYSAASHCFGAGLLYRRLLLQTRNLSSQDLDLIAQDALKDLDLFEAQVDQKALRTVTDLQAYMVVKERLIEARQNLNRTFEMIGRGDIPYSELAYAQERITSARLWAGFFGEGGKIIHLDKGVLKESCLAKIAEAQERYQYSTAYIPGALSDTFEEIRLAKNDFQVGNYALCLFKASKAKAESDLVLNAVSITPQNLDNLIDQKGEVAEQVIADAIDEGMFPIVGYSYFEYSKNLKANDKYSSLLYAEYALELSNFDLYFKKDYKGGLGVQFDLVTTIVFFIGFLTGVLFTFSLIYRRKN